MLGTYKGNPISEVTDLQKDLEALTSILRPSNEERHHYRGYHSYLYRAFEHGLITYQELNKMEFFLNRGKLKFPEG